MRKRGPAAVKLEGESIRLMQWVLGDRRAAQAAA
jgi:hypothetical protein